jgi:hypothetical protein
MNPALDLTVLPTPAQKILSPGAPDKLKLGAARGVLPGFKPGDILTVVAALSEDASPEIAAQARSTLASFPAKILEGALASDLEPGVIDLFARLNAGHDDILEKLVLMPRISTETLGHLASSGSERITELIATNEARALAEPILIEKLYFNMKTRMSTSNRLVELAIRNGVELKKVPIKELGEVLQDELIPAPDDEPSPGDLIFMEVGEVAQAVDDAVAEEGGLLEDLVEEGEVDAAPTALAAPRLSALEEARKKKKQQETGPLHSRIAEMNMSEKIRMATIGPGAARALFLKDTNKLVAAAAIRSPMVQEQDVERISRMRTVHDEVLRIIASKGDWIENHTIKFNIVANPRTPIAQASRFVSHLRDDELKRLEKSREVSAPIRSLARQILQRKAKKSEAKLPGVLPGGHFASTSPRRLPASAAAGTRLSSLVSTPDLRTKSRASSLGPFSRSSGAPEATTFPWISRKARCAMRKVLAMSWLMTRFVVPKRCRVSSIRSSTMREVSGSSPEVGSS